MTITPDAPLEDDDLTTSPVGDADAVPGGGDADGTDGHDSDGTDGHDSDGTDGHDSDGVDA